jgi:esterase
MRLHFQAAGNGRPLLVLHGLFGSSDNWKSISQALSDQFQVWSLDLRNHGHSPHAAEMTYSIMAEDVVEFMSDHAIEHPALLGHSMGGKVAMHLALHHPDRVSKLIVVDISPRAYRPRHEEILRALASLDLKRFSSRAELEAAFAPDIPELSIRRFLLKNAARAENGTFYWRFGREEIARAYPLLNAAVSGSAPFRSPCLFIHGQKSDYLQPEDMSHIRELFPAASFRQIPNAAHWVHVENPSGFLDAIKEFLRAH